MNKMKIVYMGTPELSAKILVGLINDGFNIIGVIAQEDKPIGRKRIIAPVPTKVVAIDNNIPVFQPHRIRLEYDFVKELQPDLIITCAYGQIVPQGLLDIPKYGCINVHGSILPKYRGASPIQSALINGERETGVTIMEMIDKMDAGRMMVKETFLIDEEDNYTSLCEKISDAGLKALRKAIPLIENKTITMEEQDESKATYCYKITKDDEHLDLSKPADEVVSWIRGLSETPGAYVLLNGEVFKIYRAKAINDKDGIIGEIVQADKNGFIVQTGHGQLSLLEVQKQGKKKMDYKSFVNGEKNLIGKILS